MRLSSRSFSLLLLVPLGLHASLGFDEALARAVDRHPRLLALEARLNAADARREQAAYAPNPTLNVTLENFAGSGDVRGVDALESTVGISQTLERAGKRARRTALAASERDELAREAAVLRADILAGTARDFLNAAAAARRLTLATAAADLARETWQDAEARRASGDASATEPARARAALAVAQADLARHTAALELARAKLATHWGGTAHEVRLPAVAFTLPDTPPPLDAWLAKLDAHPRVALDASRAASRRAALHLEQANAAGDFELSGGVRYLRENSDAALVAGLSVPLPVRHRNQAAIRAARERLASSEFDIAATTRELRNELASAFQDLAATHAAALHLRREVLPASEEATALLRRAYASGQAPLFEVIEAERAAAAVHREALDQDIAYATALVHAESLVDPTFPATRQFLNTP